MLVQDISGYVMLGQFKSGYFRISGYVKFGHVRQVKPGK